MNFAKLFQGVVVGGLFSGVLLAICAAYIAFTSDSSTLGSVARNFWWLAIFYGFIFGLIAGGFLGGVISLLNLSLIRAGLCGFLITAVPAILIRVLPEFEGKFDDDFKRFGICLIVIATLTGIFVSFIQMSSYKIE